MDKAYLESGLEDKAFTVKYKTRKVGFFFSNRKKEYIMREEETFNQSKGKQIQIEKNLQFSHLSKELISAQISIPSCSDFGIWREKDSILWASRPLSSY